MMSCPILLSLKFPQVFKGVCNLLQESLGEKDNRPATTKWTAVFFHILIVSVMFVEKILTFLLSGQSTQIH